MAEKGIHGVSFRIGLVTDQDPINARVRVKFPDRDQVKSWWLPVVFPKTQNDKFYWIPDVGEQVVCLMDLRDEDGAVLGAIYSAIDAPPPPCPDFLYPINSTEKFHVTFKDGAVFEYDRNTHVAKHLAQDSALLRYDAGWHFLTIALPVGAAMSITANGATIAIDASGNVTVDGGSLILAGGGPAVARVGDSTTCPAGSGTITSGSAKVNSG